MYAYTGGTLPLIPLSFIFSTDLLYAFALALHVILHYNYILVFEVTPYFIFSKISKKATFSIHFSFKYATHYRTLSL